MPDKAAARPRRPFVDFYGEHAVSPVAQDISDLEKHLRRRNALYMHLGLPPAWVGNLSVIEFGPGGGHNALHTLGLGPRRYVLVDANPAGLASVQQLLAAGIESGVVEIARSLIEEYDSAERFDLVLCEGVIPGQLDPSAFLRRVARFARPGGVVVATCADSVSYCPEILRRVMADLIAPPALPMEQRLSALLPVFSPHLATLEGMSRPHEDWIIDNLLQPLIGKYFSILEAIEALHPEFDIHGSSPRFITDWRWYKSLHADPPQFNHAAALACMASMHNFLDHSILTAPRDPQSNRPMMETCDAIFEAYLGFQNSADPSAAIGILALTRTLCGHVREFSESTAGAFEDFARWLETFLDTGRNIDHGRFAPLFGRGQQYLSFIRCGQ